MIPAVLLRGSLLAVRKAPRASGIGLSGRSLGASSHHRQADLLVHLLDFGA